MDSIRLLNSKSNKLLSDYENKAVIKSLILNKDKRITNNEVFIEK